MSYTDPEKDREYNRAYCRAYYKANKAKLLAYSREYVTANAEKTRAYHKKYQKEHLEKARERHAKYRAKNREKVRTYQAAYRVTHQERDREKLRAAKNKRRAFRRRNDPSFRLVNGLRTRLHHALAGIAKKSARTRDLLGCSVEFLREHLEKQFQPGMTWENYGSVWHVDHILPCAAFHLQHSEEQEICFNWSNLQPLFAKDNIRKGDKIRHATS